MGYRGRIRTAIFAELFARGTSRIAIGTFSPIPYHWQNPSFLYSWFRRMRECLAPPTFTFVFSKSRTDYTTARSEEKEVAMRFLKRYSPSGFFEKG